jgi:4-methyl-5(b-hydroxyethyl)-thiazole monophosphate biosynthesis
MRALVLLADGFEEVEGITQIDFLRRAGIEVVTAGVTGKTIEGGHGIRIEADTKLKKIGTDFDAVVIPGGKGGADNIAASRDAIELIEEYLRKGKLVAAICASPGVVLGPNGILEGKRATCYPGFEDGFPESATHVEDRVVVDGNLITSKGPGTAALFAVEIIRYLLDDEAADKITEATLQKF